MIGICLLSSLPNLNAQAIPDPNQGLRAEWMKGAYGLNWKPEGAANGNAENLYIDAFLEQIEGLRTLDYIQLHLGESFTTSSVHLGPHKILESLWQGDTDDLGNPINLVVPREIIGRDPFLDMLKAVKAKGLKTQVYVNSSNLLLRRRVLGGQTVILSNPEEIPNITERWMEWCDTDAQAQEYITFLRSKTKFNIDGDFPERKYMFCYAKFILTEYAIRYGDLVDAWIFDSGKMMYLYNGDDRDSGELIDQQIYKAFADAVHKGNPNAAVSFNNSLGSEVDGENPYSSATLFDDYMFGHPFNSGKNVGDVVSNEHLMHWSNERNGFAQTNDPNQSRTWDDKVVAHFDPPMSKTSWNGGSEPALTNEQFIDWYGPYLINGAALSLGLPLESQVNWNNLFVRDFAMTQLELLDAHLMKNQAPGKANWARQETVLPDAYGGQEYFHKLKLGEDFWDPEGDAITSLYIVNNDNAPAWLKISKAGDNYVLKGNVSDAKATSYSFRLRIKNDAGLSTRWVTLNVEEKMPTQYASAEIKASANTNYGIGEVATMRSELLTAPDGLATYKIELKVTPPNNKAIVSGTSGGDASEKAWGMGNGTNSTNDKLFNGDDQDWVENISDVYVVNFKPNGSTMSISDLVFESITVSNAGAVHDAIKFDFNNGIVKNVNNVRDNIESINLGIENLAKPVTNFSFGTRSNTVGDPTKNKWSVEGINVRVSFTDEPVATLFQNCNYNGASISLEEGEYPRIAENGFPYNWLSSLIVPDGYKVILYENTFFRGATQTLTADDVCLINNNFDDQWFVQVFN